jgi:hypothetical protein
MLNKGNQIQSFISSSGSGTIINSGSGSDFLTIYGPVPLVKKLRTVPCGSGSTTLPVELLLAVDVLTYQLPHQVVLGALLPPSQAPQLLSRALRPRDIRTGLKI